jgi:HSP20 family protein
MLYIQLTLEEDSAMNSLATQDPWSFVPRLQSEINRVFDDANQSDTRSATATWVPAVDIREYTDRFELYVDLPGVDPGKVDLTLEGGILTLSGQRTAPEVSKPNDEAQYTRS